MIPGIAPAIVLRTGAADPLAEYYGSGDGDIVIDWDFSDDATVTVAGDGTISKVVNKGGWGPTYDLGPSSGTSLLYGAGGFALANGSKSGLRIGATSVNLYGLHALTAVAGSKQSVLAAGWSNPYWGCGGQFGYSRVVLVFTGTSMYFSTPLGADDLIEYEVRAYSSSDPWYGRAAKESPQSGSIGGENAPTYTYVGATNAQGTPVARIRRIVLVKQDSAYDMADPEPAVLAARAWLEADADAYNDGL